MSIPNTENVVTPEGEIPKQFSMIQTGEWIIERQRKMVVDFQHYEIGRHYLSHYSKPIQYGKLPNGNFKRELTVSI